MKSSLIGLCVFFLLKTVLSQGSFGGSEIAKTNPDHPGKCWSEENKMSYSPEEKFIVKGDCREATCTNYENTVLLLVYRGCPMSRHPTDCKYVAKQPDLDFPDCCPELLC